MTENTLRIAVHAEYNLYEQKWQYIVKYNAKY